jgi:hypothetical protein
MAWKQKPEFYISKFKFKKNKFIITKNGIFYEFRRLSIIRFLKILNLKLLLKLEKKIIRNKKIFLKIEAIIGKIGIEIKIKNKKLYSFFKNPLRLRT